MDTRNYKLDHKLRVKSEDPIYHFHEYDIDIASNHIYLVGIDRGYDIVGQAEPGVDYFMVNRFIKNMNLCMRANPDKPLVIHMKTCGGDWNEGIAIYDMIKSYPFPVTILNYTHARSMSSVILQAANKRIMMPNSHFMFHDGTYAIDGTYKLVQSTIAFDKRTEKKMLDIYIESMQIQGKFKGQTSPKIRNWLRSQMDKKEDVYLTAEESIIYGFADEIFDSNWSNLTQYTDDQLKR